MALDTNCRILVILRSTKNNKPISTPSCDPPQSGEDRLQLTGLMSLCTKLQKHVLDLEEAKTAQAKEIAIEDASKQGRKIADLDDDAEPIVNAAKTTSSSPVSAADPVTTAGEVVTTASATTTIDELTLAQTLIEIKAAKPKAFNEKTFNAFSKE
ncbi:hypothetical protein Tco_0173282 [Tanacetum coccineum]